MKYQCSRSGSCIITTATRNICKFCRYQKCLDVGMKPDGRHLLAKQSDAVGISYLASLVAISFCALTFVFCFLEYNGSE